MAYEKETLQKWGNTAEFRESLTRTSNYGKSDWKCINRESDKISYQFAINIDQPISDDNVQKLVQDWQNHITKYFYKCTPEILKDLGEMYVADERFKKHYDDIKPGLAQYFSNAIKYFCENK